MYKFKKQNKIKNKIKLNENVFKCKCVLKYYWVKIYLREKLRYMELLWEKIQIANDFK